MALFDRNRFCALASAFMVSAVLAGCGSSGGGGTPPGGNNNPTFTSGTQSQAQITNLLSAGGGNDVVDIEGDTVSDIGDGETGLAFRGFLDGRGGDEDEVQLVSDGRVASIAFSNTAPPSGSGALHLQRYEIITITGGRVDGLIDASAAFDPATPGTDGITFNLVSGMVGSAADGAITGSGRNDTFNFRGGTIIGAVDGGAGADTFNFEGSTITGAVDGGAGADTFNFGGSTITGNVDGGAEVDIFMFTGGRVTGNVLGGAGNDMFTWSGGTMGGYIDGGGDTDTFTATAAVNVRVTTDDGDTDGDVRLRNVENITLSDEDDALALLSGTVGGDINTGGGNDEVRVTSGVTFTSASINGGVGDEDRFVWGAGLTATAVLTLGTATDPEFRLSGVTDFPNPTNFEVFVLAGGTITGNFIGRTDIVDRFEYISGTLDGQLNAGGGGGDIFSAAEAISTDGAAQGITVMNDTNIVRVNGDGIILLSGFENITLSRFDDTFEVNSNSREATLIDGGAGVDRFVWGDGRGATGVTVTGTADEPMFTISSNLVIDSLINFEVFVLDGGMITGTGDYTGDGNANQFELLSGSVGGNIDMGGDNDIITLSGGTVSGNVLGGAGNDIFNLEGGMIGGHVDGGANDDTIILGGTMFTNSDTALRFIDGGAGTDSLQYTGASGTTFAARDGLLDDDAAISNGTGSVRNIESQAPPTTSSLGAGLRGAFGFEVLGLSPALNLYGAMSDALMQFGQQTAQGFALADLNLATGRATQLVSKDSPFTKGRIWAHKITHSGNGKGSIGLGLTGLTARADSDYDYEMSLTQHGFDAPLATTRLGAFNLRAVSHTMTGTIETNVAQANVSGYGAGLALLWNSGAAASKASASAHHKASASAHHHGLSAHITSLAGAYEVEAHTSPLNPRAVVSEVSEGSFSAINAVVSAGVADTRKLGHSLVLRTTADIVWQTLSLDDFTETGSGGSAAHGIIINFDKATRFTARVGAGLEGEHWFSDVVFVHETSSGGTLSSGLRQDYKQDDGTAIEMKLGGKLADLATGLTLKAYAGLRTSLTRSDAIDPSAHLALNWRF